MKKIIIQIIILFSPFLSYSQYSSSLGIDSMDIIERLQGEGVQILNAKVVCLDSAEGLYQGAGNLGIDTGIVLSTGRITQIFKPYSSDYLMGKQLPYSATSTWDGILDTLYFNPLLKNYGLDSFILTLLGCGVSFDIIPANDRLEIPYIFANSFLDSLHEFGSDGYADLVNHTHCHCTPYTHFMGIFISGSSFGDDTVNYGIYPQGDEVYPNAPVNRYTLSYTPEGYLVECTGSTDASGMYWGGYPRTHYLRYNSGGHLLPDINYPGMTIPMTADIPVNPCDTYRVVVGISLTIANYYGAGLCHSAPHENAGLFVGKISSPGANDSCATASIHQLQPHHIGVTLAPNPFANELRFMAKDPNAHYSISVIDILGRTIGYAQGTAHTLQAAINKKINPNLPTQQFYFWKITESSSGRTAVVKMRKE